MNYPNYQGAPAGYPAQPDPYRQPQGQPAYGAQPGYPQQQTPVQPGYGQQPPAPVQLAGPPPTMNEFMTQPAGGGNSLKFEVVGTRYSGFVVRTVSRADLEKATEMGDRTKIAKYPDGREKLILKVPLLLDAPNPQYPDGTATLIIKAGDRNELLRAMEAAGAQVDPEVGFLLPRAGDHIVITYTNDQPSRNGMNPKKVKRIDYTVGNGQVPQLPQVVPGQVVQSQYGQQPQLQQPQYAQPPQMQMYSPTPPPTQPQYVPQPQYAQPPQMQMAQQPDPAQAYYQATGQPLSPQQQMQAGPYGQPQADWNPYAQQSQQALPPLGFNGQVQVTNPPTPASPAPGMSPSGPAQPSGAPFPSNQVPGGPPPDWPADVPFQPGLTVAQARTAQAVKLGMAQQAPPQ